VRVYIYMKFEDKNLIKIIKSGGTGVLPTDTLYGLVGLALSKKVVEKIYKIRKRNPKKPCIILISKISDLKLFGIKLQKAEKEFLEKYWPGEASIVLNCPLKKFAYLHRGTKTLAIRMPKKESLRKLISKTGPILAPSANPENLSPALTISDAKKYFGKDVDFYINIGRLEKKPSTLVRLKDGEIEILRQGKIIIS